MICCSPDNVLHLDWSDVVGYPCTVHIASWQQGIRWTAALNEKDETFDRLEDLGIPLTLIANQPEAASWFKTIPAFLIPPLFEFESKCPDLVFPLLGFLSRYSRAVDLFVSTPLLVLLILHCARRMQWDDQTIISLFSEKRTRILDACGLLGTRAGLRLLQKLSYTQFRESDREQIQRFQKVPGYLELRHLRYLDFPLLGFLLESPHYSGSRLFTGYSSSWPWSVFHRLRKDIIRMAETLNVAGVERAIAECRNLHALNTLHDRLVIRMNKRDLMELPLTFYPPPPLAGSDQFVPITDSRTLCLEGLLQHHCVAGFSGEIVKQRYYVYKVMFPERATLGLRITGRKAWQLDQLKLRYNKMPSPETFEAAHAWLAN